MEAELAYSDCFIETEFPPIFVVFGHMHILRFQRIADIFTESVVKNVPMSALSGLSVTEKIPKLSFTIRVNVGTAANVCTQLMQPNEMPCKKKEIYIHKSLKEQFWSMPLLGVVLIQLFVHSKDCENFL